MKDIVYLNGALIPKEQATISVSDYGFLYGYGLFETMRAYEGTVFRIDAHMRRLEISATDLGIPVYTDELKQAVYETLHANELKNARIRLTVSAGEGSMVPDLHSCRQPTILIVASEYHPFSEERYMQGFRLMTSDICRNSTSPVPAMKTLNYMENLLARHNSKTEGYDEALILNDTGMVAECATSNLFIVKDGILKTPGLASGLLPGITRYVVLELAQQLALPCEMAAISGGAVSSADEVFIGNSIMEIMPVSGLDSRIIGTGEPGEVTLRLMKAYRDLVMKETT